MCLAERGILITRPLAQATGLASLLREQGARPELFPIIEIQERPDQLARLPNQFASADWVIFVSPSAIDCAMPRLSLIGPKPRLACIGAASAAKLSVLARAPVLYPTSASDSHALLQLPELSTVAGQRILIVRGEGGRAELGQALRQRQAQVDYADIYRRVDSAPDWPRFDHLMNEQRLDACIVTSSEIAERLFQLAGSARIQALQCLHYCVPHPRIAERLAALGVARIVTTRADDEALVAGLREWFSRHP